MRDVTEAGLNDAAASPVVYGYGIRAKHGVQFVGGIRKIGQGWAIFALILAWLSLRRRELHQANVEPVRNGSDHWLMRCNNFK